MSSYRQGVVDFANSKVGGKYVWGGTTDAGYDCSGLIYTAYASQGVSISRVAQDQYNETVRISPDQLQKGDLVFFSDTGSVNNVTHVGMYIGNGYYTHAANSSKGIVTEKLDTIGSYYVGAGTYGPVSAGTPNPNAGAVSGGSGVVSGGSGGGGHGTTGSFTVSDDEDLSFREKVLRFLGHVVKVLTIILIFAVAAVLFMKAFDIKKPSIL